MIAIVAAVVIVLVAGKTYIVLTRWQVYYILSIFYLLKKITSTTLLSREYCYPCFRGWEIDGEVKKLAHELHDCEAKP